MSSRKPPKLKSKKGRKGCITDPVTKKRFGFIILDEILKKQSHNDHKIITLQRIQFESDGRIELRLAYYTIGKLPKMKGKWVWGQYATLLPAKDFVWLYKRAKRMGWFR